MNRALLLFFLLSSFSKAFASSGPTNFQLGSAPIPYPSFTVGSADNSLGGTYLHISEGTADLSGAGLDYKGRYAPTSFISVGFEMPFNYLSGDLGADFNSGTLKMYNATPMVNTQIQLWKSGEFSAIAFAGINFGYGHATITQSTGDITMTLRLVSAPMGVQLGIPISHGVSVAPFYFYTRGLGGIATFDSSQGKTSTRIPSFSTQSYGLDVIIPKKHLSIGTLLQSTLQAAQKMNTLSLSIAWLFGGSVK